MRFIKWFKINHSLLLTQSWFIEKCKLGVMSFVAQTMDILGSRCEAEHPHSLRNKVQYYLLMELGDSSTGFVCSCVLSLSSEQGWAEWPQTHLHPTQSHAWGCRKSEGLAAECIWLPEHPDALQDVLHSYCPCFSLEVVSPRCVTCQVCNLLGVSPVRYVTRQACNLSGVSASPSSADPLLC